MTAAPTDADRLAFRDSGPPPDAPAAAAAAAPMLLVHGWLDDAGTWAELWPALTARRRVVAPDLRGHGASRDLAPAGFGRYVLDLVDLLERCELTGVTAVGHSMGASFATLLAIERPDLVGRLVLVDPDYGGSPSGRAPLQRLAATADDVALKAGVAEHLLRRVEAATSTAALRERHRAALDAVPPPIVAATLRANLDDPWSLRFAAAAEPALRARRQPVLALHRDPERRRLERRVARAGSRVLLVEDAGHWIHQERPAFVLDEAEHWLATLPDRPNP